MRKPIFLHKNYTLNEEGYQLKLAFNLKTIIPEDDPVRLLSQFVKVTHNIFYTAITRAREKLRICWTPEVEEKVIKRINV